MTFLPSDSILERVEYTVQSVVCRAEIQGKAGFIMDSSYDKLFRDFLFLSMEKETKIREMMEVLCYLILVYLRRLM